MRSNYFSNRNRNERSQHHNPNRFRYGIFSKTRVSEVASPDGEIEGAMDDTEFDEWMRRNTERCEGEESEPHYPEN